MSFCLYDVYQSVSMSFCLRLKFVIEEYVSMSFCLCYVHSVCFYVILSI